MVAYEMGFTCQLNENAQEKQAEIETAENYDESVEYLFLYALYTMRHLVLPVFSFVFLFSPSVFHFHCQPIFMGLRCVHSYVRESRIVVIRWPVCMCVSNGVVAKV